MGGRASASCSKLKLASGKRRRGRKMGKRCLETSRFGDVSALSPLFFFLFCHLLGEKAWWWTGVRVGAVVGLGFDICRKRFRLASVVLPMAVVMGGVLASDVRQSWKR